MRIKELFTDDDAVSPVIGVILMVAITVILAAVIASFVLGLGQSTQQTPQASFGFDYDKNSAATTGSGFTPDGFLVISHQSGDSIKITELFVRGEKVQTGQWAKSGGGALGGSASTTVGSTSAVAAGDNVNITAASDYDAKVVWQPEEGGESAELAADTGPDA